MFRRLMFFFIGLGVVLVMSLSTSSTAHAQSSIWTAQYFNNTTLSGTPVGSTTLSNLNINWGRGAPITGVNVDDWTARFNTSTYFNAGTYRFTINADDAFRLYVNGQLRIDTFVDPKPNQTFTTEVALPTGNANIQIDYREYIGDAFLYVWWQQTNVTATPTQTQTPGAWTAQYFNNVNLSGTAAAVSSLGNLNVNWGYNSPANGVIADNWSARFNASIYFTAGTYRFSINADDAFGLYVNNNVVLETFSYPVPDTVKTIDVNLPAGYVNLQVDYREYIGPAFLYLSWNQINSTPNTPEPQLPGQASLIINTGRLNMRSTPYVGDNVIKTLPNGASYLIIGRTASTDWYQIRDGATVGWVSAAYVIARDTANVPVVNTQVSAPNSPVTATGFSLQANAFVNIRSGAGTNYSRLSILPYKATASIVARNYNNTWWLISYNGVTGWVSSGYIILPYNINYTQIPVI